MAYKNDVWGYLNLIYQLWLDCYQYGNLSTVRILSENEILSPLTHKMPYLP